MSLTIVPPAISGRFIHTMTTAITTVKTVPEDRQIHIYKLFICNKSDVENATFDLMIWYTDLNKYVYIFKNHIIPSGITYEIWGINLKHGDILRCKSNIEDEIDLSGNYMEFNISPEFQSVFKSQYISYGNEVNSSELLFYTCPVNNSIDIHDIFIYNTSDDDNVFLDLILEQNDGQRVYIIKNNRIYSKNYQFIRKINLSENDKIYCKSNKDGCISVLFNMLLTKLS